MQFELNNEQRAYFGLEPIKPNWEKVMLKGDTYRQESILYFEGDVIKRYITSTDYQYKECQYDDLTRSRNILLPKTSKGKEKKLTASVLESRQPIGIYCLVDSADRILIGNYDTQTSFYDSSWERVTFIEKKALSERVAEFIKTCPANYLAELAAFKKKRKRNIKFKPGDFFAFKINRAEYGFGRILLDIADLKDRKLIPEDHGLAIIMAKPVMIKIYAYVSSSKEADIRLLQDMDALPSDYMMDNALFYGEFEIIGHAPLRENDFDFPMSYGQHISSRKYCVFLQWGMIHLELSVTTFNKYLVADNPFAPKDRPSGKTSNPFGYYGIGFKPKFGASDIKATVENNGKFDFSASPQFRTTFDLRNPQNRELRAEIMEAFSLDPDKGYDENCRLTKTLTIAGLIKLLG